MVDDEANDRALARDMLVSVGYVVLETGDPYQALRTAKDQPIHLLLADVIMPLMKGTELADRMQAVSPSTKVLLMSGYQTADIAHSGRPLLIKPFRVEGLAEKVRETLSRPPAFVRPRRSP
ncbi:MAG TPA: response regulator [Methylomirabilota bacterium]|nr:response regulator [Methylomirabilota bacterium]